MSKIVTDILCIITIPLFYWKVVIPLVGWLNDVLEDDHGN